MGFLQEGSPPFHYILLRKPLKSARVARGGQGPSDSSAAARHRRYPGRWPLWRPCRCAALDIEFLRGCGDGRFVSSGARQRCSIAPCYTCYGATALKYGGWKPSRF